jgi:hypothetical protein
MLPKPSIAALIPKLITVASHPLSHSTIRLYGHDGRYSRFDLNPARYPITVF